MGSVIVTARLRLRPRRIGDLAASVLLDREPGGDGPLEGPGDDPVAHRRAVDARIRAASPSGLGSWAILRRAMPAQMIGVAWLLCPEDGPAARAEIGLRIAVAARGRGYGPEAAAALIAHGFGRAGLREIVAGVTAGNIAARRVAEKIGMTQAAGPADSGAVPASPHVRVYRARLDCAR